MTKRLFVYGSMRGEESVSRALAEHYKLEVQARDTGAVKELDLAQLPLQPLDGELLGAFFAPDPEGLTAIQKARLAVSDELIRDLFDADELVIATGMYNFGVSGYLKNFVDHICRAGQTFCYTAAGPEGLVRGKRAVIVVATGGAYSGAAASMDFVVPYLVAVLGFIGITDVKVVRAEGLAMGEDSANAALAGARSQLEKLV